MELEVAVRLICKYGFVKPGIYIGDKLSDSVEMLARRRVGSVGKNSACTRL